MTRWLLLGLLLLLGPRAGAAAEACGASTSPCTVPLGTYFAASPPWHEGDPSRPVVVFLHGAGGSGAAAVEDHALADPIAARGYVLIAPAGLKRPGRDGEYWSFGDRPPVRDERAFLEQVLADATPRVPPRSQPRVRHRLLDGWRDRLAARLPGAQTSSPPSGRSRAASGASCRPTAPARSGCSTPMAGVTTPCRWRVGPRGRPGPGRHLRGAAGLASGQWLRRGPCRQLRASRGQFWQRSWTGCAPGSALTFVLHPGGHEVPDGWADLALDWFETVVPASH